MPSTSQAHATGTADRSGLPGISEARSTTRDFSTPSADTSRGYFDEQRLTGGGGGSSSKNSTSAHGSHGENEPQHGNSPNSPSSPALAFLLLVVEWAARALTDAGQALLLRIPYSLHLEGWSAGNPTLALIVVHWTSHHVSGPGPSRRGESERDASHGDAASQDSHAEHDDDGHDADSNAAGMPSAWGFSASDWTSSSPYIFFAAAARSDGPARESGKKSMVASVPSSPVLRATPSSPRMLASAGPSTPWALAAVRSGRQGGGSGAMSSGGGASGSGGVPLPGLVDLDWSGASASSALSSQGFGLGSSSSPRIRPTLGWSSGGNGSAGRSISHGGGGAAASSGGRRTSASGPSSSQPGTPSAILSSPRFSPFFGPTRSSSSAAAVSSAQPAFSEIKRGKLPEDDDGGGVSLAQAGSSGSAADHVASNTRARSASISSLASVPELSLGAAAVSLSQGSSSRPDPRFDPHTPSSSSSQQQQHARSEPRRRPRSRTRRKIRRLPVRMYRFALTYAALLHYISTALGLRALAEELRLVADHRHSCSAPSRWAALLSALFATGGVDRGEDRAAHASASSSLSRDRTRMMRAMVLVLICGMTMEARGKAEGLGLRRSSLGANVLLLVVVLALLE
ncbi:hypothetical protein V8E36_004039 [Tilletia maclaganii]